MKDDQLIELLQTLPVPRHQEAAQEKAWHRAKASFQKGEVEADTSPFTSFFFPMPRYASIAMIILMAFTLTAGAWVIFGQFFQERMIYETGNKPIDVVTGDIDLDGHLDILVGNRNDGTVSIYFGEGDGQFYMIEPINIGNCPASLALGDYDQDKDLDLIVGQCNAGSILLMQGDGRGGFERTATLNVGGAPYNVTFADLNNDGFLDVVASDYPGARLIVIFQDEYGAYDKVISLPTGKKTIAVQVGDLNNDGYLDLISSDHIEGSSSVFLNDQNENFAERIVVKTGKLPYSIALDYIDDDDTLDLLVAHSTENGSITIHRGLGDGHFELLSTLNVQGTLVFIDSGDFNRDGFVDILTTHDKAQFATLYFGQKGLASFLGPYPVPAENKVYSLAIADFNQDGLPDFATVDYEANTLSISLGMEYNLDEVRGVGE